MYEDDGFRKRGLSDEDKQSLKGAQYKSLAENKSLFMDQGLQIVSPKLNRMMKNIQKFMDGDTPRGKVLFYSEYRGDSGAEIFEQVLQANGYEKFDYQSKDKEPKKRYTFITGTEGQEERRYNKEAFNSNDNIYGQNIQIMIISGAGAEGISLTCVRQVHIFEPYWNYVRINQVFGRAICLSSHKDLPEDERNVEQYLYLAVYPEGNSIEDIFKNIQTLDGWESYHSIQIKDDIKNELYTNHKDLYMMIQNMIRIKTNTRMNSIDQYLFDMMERKYIISQKIITIIKEASIDCIQHTRDDPELNQNCVRYDKNVQDEDAFFPGVTANTLNQIDSTQLSSRLLYFIEPDIYVVSALEDKNRVFLYYQSSKKDIDIRYIREYGKLKATLDNQYMYVSQTKDHPLNSEFSPKLSVYEEIYLVPSNLYEKIDTGSYFPPLDKVLTEEIVLDTL